jgi:hypothetical protein
LLFVIIFSKCFLTVQLAVDVEEHGLSVIVLADWHSRSQIAQLKFFDDNTHNWWLPETGGANTPALNSLLDRWGISFGEGAFSGNYVLGEQKSSFISGSVLRGSPAGSVVVSALLTDDEHQDAKAELLPIISLLERGAGRVAVYGDSSCLDDAAQLAAHTRCDWLLDMLLSFTRDKVVPAALQQVANVLSADLVLPMPASAQMDESALHLYSRVMANATHTRAVPLCPRVVWTPPQVMGLGTRTWAEWYVSTYSNTTRRAVRSEGDPAASESAPSVILMVCVIGLLAVLMFWLRGRRRA